VAHTVDSNLIAQAWAKDLLKRLKEKSIVMTRYASYDDESVIQEKDDLTKDEGDRINFGLLPMIPHRTTAYVDDTGTKKGDAALETNEDTLTFRGDYVLIDQRRRAVVSDGKFFEKKISFKFRKAAQTALARWSGGDVDWVAINALTVTGAVASTALDGDTHKRLVCTGDATGSGDLVAGDTITMADIFRLKLYAEASRINPINIGGVEYYLLLLHPEVMYDLKMQTPSSVVNWWETQLHAAVRGSNNPIFKGSDGIIDGVILARHRDIHLCTTWGSTNDVRGCKNLLLGAQAGMWGWAMKPWWVDKTFDYGNKLGTATGYMAGCKASVFGPGDQSNDYEFGCVGFYSASSGALGAQLWN
jgi:N4-gp56 family major capsid protein